MGLTYDERRVLDLLLELTKTRKILWTKFALGGFESTFDGLKVKFIENCPWGPEIHIYYFGNGIADIFDIDLETADDLSVAVEAACETLGLGFAEEIMRKRRLK